MAERERRDSTARDREKDDKDKASPHKKRRREGSSATGKGSSSHSRKSTGHESLSLDGNGFSLLSLKLLRAVFRHVPETDLCRLACVSKQWSAFLSEDGLWKELYFEHFPDEKSKKKSGYKESFKQHVLRAEDPLQISLGHSSVPPPGTRNSSRSSRRHNNTSHIKRRKDTVSKGDGVPFIVTDTYSVWTKDLLAWLNERIEEYKIVADGLPSLGSGEALLALLHKTEPSAIDYASFDKRVPEKTLAAVFSVAEETLGIPALLEPREVVANSDPRSLLLYLACFKTLHDESQRDPVHEAHAEIGRMLHALDEFTSHADQLEDEFEDATATLGAVLSLQEEAEDTIFQSARATFMDKALLQAMDTIHGMEEHSKLLLEQNRVLSERLQMVERDLRIEETTRKRLEELLEIEERIKAMGEELSERGALDYLKMTERKDAADQ